MGMNHSVVSDAKYRNTLSATIWPGITESDVEVRFNLQYLDTETRDACWKSLYDALKEHGYTLGEVTRHNQAIVYISYKEYKTLRARCSTLPNIDLVWYDFEPVLKKRHR
jgi:hypothetical protein